MNSAQALALVIVTFPWTAQVEALNDLLVMCFSASVGWLAFKRFDTKSGVTVLPRRWADVGLPVVLAWAVWEAIHVGWLLQMSAEKSEEMAGTWTAHYTGLDGELLFGWLTVSVLASATGEEIVYRGLLLRALEGFMHRWLALMLHAVVFELVHIFVYGYGFYGGTWFFVALILGHAFQRTKSIAVPVLLHAITIVIFHTLVWTMAR